MCAFDLPDKKTRDQFLEDTEANGLLLLGCGVSSIRFRPHLIVNQEEIDFAFDLMEKSI
jgi:L-lysine 6-transaminase